MPPSDNNKPRSGGGLKWITILGLGIALFSLPLLSFANQATSVDLSRLGVITLQWVLLLLIVGVTIFAEEKSLRSIGVKRPELIDIGYLIVATVLGFLALAATGPLVEHLGLTQAEQGGLGVAETGVEVAIISAISIGVVEEALFRGYAIERLDELTGSAIIAGAVSWIVFTVAHAATWQFGDLLQISLAALVFTLVYLQRRSLVPVVGAHILIWLFGVLGAIYG